jgi:hypothetical protein
MIDRRTFLCTLSAAGAVAGAMPVRVDALPSSANVKRIAGSCFEFQHHAAVEGVDWNPACARFTAAQWSSKIQEMAEAGIEYLVLMDTALYNRSFFRTSIFPQWQLGCSDLIEVVLSAADRHHVKFFIGGGFDGD